MVLCPLKHWYPTATPHDATTQKTKMQWSIGIYQMVKQVIWFFYISQWGKVSRESSCFLLWNSVSNLNMSVHLSPILNLHNNIIETNSTWAAWQFWYCLAPCLLETGYVDRFLWFFWVPPCKCWDSTLKQARTASYLILCYITYAIERA
jgi:hypothetical protein